VAVLILAPVLEEPEDGVHLVFGVRLEVAIDGDVAPVANFLGEIGGVEDELGLEEGVLLALGQKAQVELEVEVRHRLVEEASVAGLIAGHQVEALGQHGAFVFEATAQFLVKQEAGKLGGAGAL